MCHPCVLDISRRLRLFYASDCEEQVSIALAASADGLAWEWRGAVLSPSGRRARRPGSGPTPSVDPSRQGELVTHRVVSVEEKQGKLAFVTKGDANTGTEQWAIEADGEIATVQFTIPKVGYWLSWSADPARRVALLLTACVLLAVAALRRIWST